MLEKRDARMIVNLSGNGSSTFRATIPTTWVRSLELSEEERDLELELYKDKIIIKKKEHKQGQ